MTFTVNYCCRFVTLFIRGFTDNLLYSSFTSKPKLNEIQISQTLLSPLDNIKFTVGDKVSFWASHSYLQLLRNAFNEFPE